MDYKVVSETIQKFIGSQIIHVKGAVVGLSGGIDSTVVAYLAVNALGKDNVYGLVMPYKHNQNTMDSEEIAKTLGIQYR